MEILSKQIHDYLYPKLPDKVKPYSHPFFGAEVGLEIWIPAYLTSKVLTPERISQLPETIAYNPIQFLYSFIYLIADHPTETILPCVALGAVRTVTHLLANRKQP